MFDGQFYPFQPLQFMDGLLVPIIGAGAPDIVIGSVGTPYQTSADASSYTATGLPSIGGSERGLVGIIGRGAATRTLSSVQIGGNAMTHVHTFNNTDSVGTTVAFYIGDVSHSGDVSWSLSGNWLRAAAILWPLQNVQSAVATDTLDSETNPLSGTIDCQVGGAVFGLAYNNAGNAFTWTGITEVFDALLESGHQGTAASTAFATAQTGLTVTADTTSEGAARALTAIALR